MSKKAKKLARYREEFRSLARSTDRLGVPIDADIKKTVALLNLLGFPTVASCAGHVEVSHGTLTPWIDIMPKHGYGLKRKMWKVISDFNEWRQKKNGYRAEGFKPHLFYFRDSRTAFRVQIGQDLINNVFKDKKCLSKQSREWLHAQYAIEMKEFTKFLWKRYMKG